MNSTLIVTSLAFLLVVGSSHATVPSHYAKQSADWLQSEEGRRIAGHVITWQSPRGSWPKNRDTATRPFEGDGGTLKGTFDNGATTGELAFLARAFTATGEPRCKEAFLKGFDHILEAQYPAGGWPQFHPPENSYHRHITFNDNSMVRILEFLRDAARSFDPALLDPQRRTAAEKAFDRGVQCILQSQIVVNGKRTVWCGQHDEVDLRPRPARSYELESLSGAESAGILKLLMSLEKPGPEIRTAIRAGVDWYASAKIDGIRIADRGGDRVVVDDPKAPPVWARFYEIETNRPFFCGRDGVKKYRLSEIEAERRKGYSWYGSWGRGVAEAYEKWQRQW